jgi:pimeloyl-ACP methyl ester carboxylesterase
MEGNSLSIFLVAEVSSIPADRGVVHYEVHGRRRKVALLHGRLGTWGLWRETVVHLGAFYPTCALAYWGFGESDKKF